MTNPLLSPSALPFGLPPFADMTDAHYAEAVDAGLAEHLAEIQAIVDNAAPATFENTAVAMERSGGCCSVLPRPSSHWYRPTPRTPSATSRPSSLPALPPTRMPSTSTADSIERFADIDTERPRRGVGAARGGIPQGVPPVRHPAGRRRPGEAQVTECGTFPAGHGIRAARQGRDEVGSPAAGRCRGPGRPAGG